MKTIALIATLLCGGCLSDMGGSCNSSSQCMWGGTCLKGVCSNYDCESDDDCRSDMVCGNILGVETCVTECDADADCDGDQTCTTPEPGNADSGGADPTNDYCL